MFFVGLNIRNKPKTSRKLFPAYYFGKLNIKDKPKTGKKPFPAYYFGKLNIKGKPKIKAYHFRLIIRIRVS